MKYDTVNIYKKDDYTVIYTEKDGHHANFWWYYTLEETAQIGRKLLSEQKDKFRQIKSKRFDAHFTGENVEAPLIK